MCHTRYLTICLKINAFFKFITKGHFQGFAKVSTEMAAAYSAAALLSHRPVLCTSGRLVLAPPRDKTQPAEPGQQKWQRGR
jgi:hypothetical protein